jgi:Fe2+ transport system protein FeoA
VCLIKTINLYDAKKYEKFTVASIPKIDLLENLGICAGTSISLCARYIFGGPVLLRIEDSYTVALGKEIAKQIEVLI